jgi:hypothetical protein
MAHTIPAYLAHEYTGKVLQLCEDYCPRCLKGGKNTTLHVPASNKSKFFTNLCSTALYEYQALSAAIPKTPSSVMRFKHPLLNIEKPGPACADDCPQLCMFCYCVIEGDQERLAICDDRARPSVHAGCMTTCAYVELKKGKTTRCQSFVPAVPEYHQRSIPPAMCGLHREGATPPRTPSKPPPYPSKPAPTPSMLPAPEVPPPMAPARVKLSKPTPRRPVEAGQPTLEHFVSTLTLKPTKRCLEEELEGPPRVIFTPHRAGKGRRFDFNQP